MRSSLQTLFGSSARSCPSDDQRLFTSQHPTDPLCLDASDIENDASHFSTSWPGIQHPCSQRSVNRLFQGFRSHPPRLRARTSS